MKTMSEESLPSSSSDCVTSGSSTDSNTVFVHSPVSLLERLCAPELSELSRKWKVHVNTPPIGRKWLIQF